MRTSVVIIGSAVMNTPELLQRCNGIGTSTWSDALDQCGISGVVRGIVQRSGRGRFAGFAVLKAPDIPSVLVEIGFLSHPREEKVILSRATRERITGGIAAGVDAYFKEQKRMGEM